MSEARDGERHGGTTHLAQGAHAQRDAGLDLLAESLAPNALVHAAILPHLVPRLLEISEEASAVRGARLVPAAHGRLDEVAPTRKVLFDEQVAPRKGEVDRLVASVA